jgi:hypothetical protein
VGIDNKRENLQEMAFDADNAACLIIEIGT